MYTTKYSTTELLIMMINILTFTVSDPVYLASMHVFIYIVSQKHVGVTV